MSKQIVFDTTPRDEAFLGVVELVGNWALRLYTITAQGVPPFGAAPARAALGGLVAQLDPRMSAEFDYGRFGFSIIHTGRRGTCVSVVHFGNWGSTFESFASVWYQYGCGLDTLELLDDMEPAFCWFELDLWSSEIRRAFQLAEANDLEGVRLRYLKS